MPPALMANAEARTASTSIRAMGRQQHCTSCLPAVLPARQRCPRSSRAVTPCVQVQPTSVSQNGMHMTSCSSLRGGRAWMEMAKPPLVQAPPQRLLLRCAVTGASPPPPAAAAAAADGPRPHAQAEANANVAGGSGSSGGFVDARVAHVYRIEGLGTLTLEGGLPGAKSLHSRYLVA